VTLSKELNSLIQMSNLNAFVGIWHGGHRK